MKTSCCNHCAKSLIAAKKVYETWNFIRYRASEYRTVKHDTDCVQVVKTASYSSERDEMIRNHPESTLVKLNKIQKVERQTKKK
jgi:hypothetical protein